MPEVKVSTYDWKFADTAIANPNYVSNQWDFDYNPELWFHCDQATMAIGNQYDDVADVATNIQKEVDGCVSTTMFYQEIKCLPGSSLPRHAPTGLPKCRPRLYWNRPARGQLWTRLDGHRSKHGKMITEAGRVYDSMSIPDNYGLQDIQYTACRSPAQSINSASAIELSTYNYRREA